MGLRVAVALLALGVGLDLAKSVMPPTWATAKMQEIACAIQEGVSAIDRCQFRTIGIDPAAVAAIALLTSTAIKMRTPRSWR